MEINKPARFTKLDGLRGLLALIVCLNHSYMVITIPAFASVWLQNPLIFHDLQSKLQQLLMFVGNGGAAVTLFFLLSGLVLGPSLSKIKMDFRGVLGFYAKRIIRLYPVYILILVLTALYMRYGYSYQTFPFSSSWYNWWMNFEMTLKEFILNFFFIHAYVGGVTWTLRVILITSFIFPVFFLLNKKTSWWTDILISVLLIYSSFTLLNIEGFRDLRYLYMFYLGLMIPKFKDFFTNIPNRTVVLVFPFAVVLMLGFRYLTDEYLGGLVEAIISFFIIGVAAYGDKVKVFNLLDGKVLKFFGKISYSLYLIHYSVLYVISRFMFQNFPNLPFQGQYFLIHTALFVLSTVIATGISLLVFKYIELPSQTLSSRVGKLISKE